MVQSINTYNSRSDYMFQKQRGAEEACWAHNPKVGGSKPLVAIILLRGSILFLPHCYPLQLQLQLLHPVAILLRVLVSFLY